MTRTSSSRLVRVSERAFHLLVLLYPPSFRRVYGREMLQVFSSACRQVVREHGVRAVLALWLRVLIDVAGSVVREWLTVPSARFCFRAAGRSFLRGGRRFLVAGAIVGVLGIVTLVREDSPGSPAGLAQSFPPTPTPYQHAVSVLQAEERTPFTGTSVTTTLAAPESGIMPPSATLDIGRRETVATWSVRDPEHYRIVLHRVLPAIESGTITIVANGRTVTTYDDRTNRASIVYLRLPPSQTPRTDPFYSAYRALPLSAPSFTSLVGGSELLPPGILPNPSQPRRLLEQTILQMPYGTARIVGRARVLGHRTDVFTLRPLYTFTWSTCSPPSRTGCPQPVGHQRGFGWGRLWIDRSHPFMLRDLEAGIPLRERQAPERYEFRVLSVRYGQGPTDSMLRYRPPMKPVREQSWCLGCVAIGGWTFWQPRRFRGFFDFPRPHGALTNALPRMQVFDASDSPLPRSSGVDILYSTGRHHDYYHPRDLQQIYALGPYVYIQQRIQRHGLPAFLQRGTPHVAGGCRLWTGSYQDGHHWLALARGPISVFVYSNALPEGALVRYAAGQLCSVRAT